MRNGQYNLPEWDKFKIIVDGVYDRKYYTNHGPLLIQLENKLSEFMDVQHAVCMTNMDIALMISLLALDIEKKILIPAFSSISIAQNALWAGLNPVYCDNAEGQPNISVQNLLQYLDTDVSAIIAVHNWGASCDIDAIKNLTKKENVKLIYCSSDVIGQTYNGTVHGSNGDLEIFSFQEKEMINGGDGACVTTNDDQLAARLRNIRSSYGARHSVKIPYTGNGRMSEIQAGLILETLNSLEDSRDKNKAQFGWYKESLDNLEEACLFIPISSNARMNFNKPILRVNKSKAHLVPNLKMKLKTIGWESKYDLEYGVNVNSLMPINGASNALSLRDSIVELPIGRLVSKEDISIICSIIVNQFNTDGYP